MDRRTFLKSLGIYLISQQFGIHGTSWALAPAATPAPSLLDSPASHQTIDNRGALGQIQEVVLSSGDRKTLETVLARFARIQATVGQGNFCLLGFDDSLRIARGYQRVGAFSDRELTFIDKLFHTDARDYGFKGRKLFHNITNTIHGPKVNKIPGTGNYLYNGSSFKLYQRLRRDIGDQLILTAGIRGVAKQFYLFLKKAVHSRGNLSVASRSLAPPGYSYHGVGDFDVGQVGYGAANFTEKFSRTKIYRNITQLDYVIFRYPRNNHVGVQFEPWHIQVDRSNKRA